MKGSVRTLSIADECPVALKFLAFKDDKGMGILLSEVEVHSDEETLDPLPSLSEGGLEGS